MIHENPDLEEDDDLNISPENKESQEDTELEVSSEMELEGDRRQNVYQTKDPEKLLQLKRLEADAILDILRSINNASLSIKNLCLIVRNLLWAQLQVKRMAFFYENEEVWEEGMRLKFDEFSEEATEEMMSLRQTTPINPVHHPHLAQLEIEYIIPIYNRGLIKAYFAISEFADSKLEEQNDLIFVETIGNILAVAIENRELFKEQMAKENLQKELEVASTIQRQLLIRDFERFAPLDIYGMNEAHSGVGGDFYDLIKKGENSVFCCIADVSGKGIGAALLMANLQANLRALCAQYDDLGVIIRELNSILFGITEGEKFVTLFLARLEFDRGTLSYVNAGHNYPILIKEGKIDRLSEGCIILGILPEVSPSETTIFFNSGNTLFMFTDGVVEQTNEQEEMFGSERIVAAVEEFQELSSKELIVSVQQTLAQFSGDVEAGDDTTMLSVKFLGQMS